jgi:hypothetical protein
MVTLARAKELKLALTDFVFDAEDELATALEAFSAEQLSQKQQIEMHRRDFVVDRFLTEGQIGEQSPIDQFIAETPDLTALDQQLLKEWRRSFVGLFAVTEVLADGFEFMNWTTAKHYTVRLTEDELQATRKLQEGDILLTQIAPIIDLDWMIFGKWISLGKLGKPKLAVAIGNFKQNYKNHLYSDAPELLTEAWKSVEKYHQNFIDFFDSNEVTMPGYQLNKKLAEFQELMVQKQLEESGIDQSKSLKELAEESGISQSEIEDTALALGADARVVEQVMDGEKTVKMMTPSVELPPHLKKAEQVTILTDPRAGQVFLPTYTQFKSLLETEASQSNATAQALAKKYLDDPAIPVFVWHRLAEEYPIALEQLLREVLAQPNFDLNADLNTALQAAGKSLQPELPEIASVPIHLHNLFQEAVLEVSKDKTKKKPKAKTTTGFQRSPS